MFDIGFSEIFVIAVVALLVLGPERLPKAARFAGLWVRRARAQWYSVKAELENELADEELKRSLLQAQEQLRDAEAALRAQAASVEQGVQRVASEVQAGVGGRRMDDASTQRHARPGETDHEAADPAAGPDPVIPLDNEGQPRLSDLESGSGPAPRVAPSSDDRGA